MSMSVELYNFQKKAVDELMKPEKHFVISGTGCLAGDTPVPLSNGTIKAVCELNENDIILSYDENRQIFVGNKVEQVIRTCHKPKPMIELEYDGEKITTTYDHPFFNGEGYYPLYQLVWGALETSQRTQLKLLCKQYGQDFNNEAVWCKHCGSNEAVKGRKWLLQDNDGRENGESSQSSGRELAKKSQKIGMCKPFELQQVRQQSRKPRVVFKEVQRLVGNTMRNNEKANELEERENSDTKRARRNENILRKKYKAIEIEPGEERTIRHPAKNVSKIHKGKVAGMGNWKIKIKVSEPYYTISMQQAPYTYCIGRKHYFITHNSGKTAMMFEYLRRKDPKKVLIVCTPSKRDSGEFLEDADKFAGKGWKEQRTIEIISWHKLYDWTYERNWDDLPNWTIAFDEVQCAAAGVSSKMGKAFLAATKHCADWTAYTATPGDVWIKFYPYFAACELVKNKTHFVNQFCFMQTYPFPAVKGYRQEDKLLEMWRSISYTPDTSEVFAQLPSKTYQVVKLKKPTGYDKCLKNSETLEGEFLDSNMALAHYMRQMCATKKKQDWLGEWLDGTDENAVIFYNYVKEREDIIEVCKKKKRKVWRIDGEKHEIPSADTIGDGDIVVAHYQSGSASLNLQFMRYWISYSYNYSYTTFLQALGRIDRIGQERPMVFWFLKCVGTIEDDVAKALKNKQDFAADVWVEEKKGG